MDRLHGDEGALYESFNDELQRDVARAVGTSAANVADACAIAWGQFLRYQPDRDRNWRGWLYRVATREAARLHRADRGVTIRVGVYDGSAPVVDPPDHREEPHIKRIEVRDALAMLSRVPGRAREVAVLHLVGLTYVEIAEALGLTYTRVDKLLRAAREDLRDQELRHAGREPEARPRVARLASLEEDPPGWLVSVIGRPPGRKHSGLLLAWRRAALAVDDYRDTDAPGIAAGMGARPSDPASRQRYDRAKREIQRLDDARRQSRARSIER
jgi:RNA polymerase sigma factor (sigma-70 family)